MRKVGSIALCLLLGCGGSTPPVETEPPTAASAGPLFEANEAVGYQILDAAGRKVGRVHCRFGGGDRRSVVTRVVLGAPVDPERALAPSRTYEYATTLGRDGAPALFKRLSSVDGRMTLTFGGGKIKRTTDVSTDELPDSASDALLLPHEDMMLLALAIAGSGLSSGQSGKLKVRTPDILEADGWLTTVYENADRQTIVQLPSGQATLDERGQVLSFAARTGEKFVRLEAPGEPPALMALPQKRTYTRPAGASWVDKRIVVPVEKGRMVGVLSEPRLRSRWEKTDMVPGILFLSDIIPANRHGFTKNADYGSWRLFDRLADQGFAVLRVDDRGVGESTSKIPPEKVTAETRLQDALALLEAMRRQPTVDPDRIIVMGHGWGAVDAMMLAKASKVRALVLLAPPARNAAEVLGDRAAAILSRDATGARVDMAAVMTALRTGSTANVDPELLKMHRPIAGLVTSYANLDVLGMAPNIKTPVAIFQGLKDFEVSWKKDAGPLSRAFGKGRAKMFVYEFVDHLMLQASKKPGPDGYRETSRRLEPDLMKDLIDWMTGQSKRP